MSVVSDYVQVISRWIVKLAYVNLLWLLFTTAGGILFGWAPATVSVFKIMRKWIRNEDTPTLPLFLKTYKSEFFKSNVSGLIIMAAATILTMNLLILLQVTNNFLSIFFLIGNGTMILTFVLFLSYFFPVYVHSTGGLKEIFIRAFLMGVAKLPVSILIVIVCTVWGRLLFSFPGLLVLFSVSIPILLITLFAQLSFPGHRRIHFEN